MTADNLSNRHWTSRDRRVLWHPFTQMRDWQTDPVLVIERAAGNYLVDVDGKKYLDGVSSLWANVHGHRVREIDQKVLSQMRRVAHSTFLGLTHPSAIELAERLIRVAPNGLRRVFYSDSGSAAVEVAIKMSYQYWQNKGHEKKKKFISFKNAYHGDTLGAVSVGGIPLFHHIFKPLLFSVIQVPAPYRYRSRFIGSEDAYARYCAKRVEQVLRKRHAEVCAVVWEPVVQGAAGMLTQPKGFGRLLRELTRKHGVHLIADEVATGFGRTGKMFACEHERIKPDFLCLAKGITGGYLPLSATLTTEEVYRAFLADYSEFKAFYHGHTYTANPLACAAALGSLEVFKKRRVLEGLLHKISTFETELKAVSQMPHVGEVRQAGMMIGIELVKNKAAKTSYPLEEKRGIRACFEARKHGVIIRPLGNVVVLMPPLSILPKEIVRLCRAVKLSIEKATEK